MVDGDRLLVSHYTEGVHLLDIRDPEHPAVLGYYDTFTEPPCTGFPFAATGARTSSPAPTSSWPATSRAACS